MTSVYQCAAFPGRIGQHGVPEPVRSRPQRNAYHQFTVDRHLWEAAANAAALADSVHRHDLLVIGALLHDDRLFRSAS